MDDYKKAVQDTGDARTDEEEDAPVSRSVSNTTLRAINQRIILDAIFEKSPTSRTELSSDLLISKPAIADNLNDLLAIGIVQECGEGEVAKGGGRKPRLIRFNKNHKYIIAIELNFKDPIFVLGNLRGNIFNEFSVKISENANSQVRMELIKNAIHILLNSKDLSPENLACIAISSPGVFPDKNELSFANPQFKDWFDLDLSRFISEEFHVDVLLKNDVNMATFGESRYGAGKNSQNILYISCGIGIGSGLILDSRLYEGRFNSAGEIFNNIDPVKLRGETNLEQCIFLSALIKKSQESMKKKSSYDEEVSDFNSIVKAYRENNPYIIKHLEEIGVELGCTVSNIVNLLSIDTVIIGGEYVVFHEILIDQISRIVNKHCLFTPSIVPSELGHNAGITGLFAISRENYFDAIIKSK
ncbi:MAG TPA: ROK family protein [Anaerovoracaceae bacterium]|nr:ROK family protein [Anaerovoracaceae bacterium]